MHACMSHMFCAVQMPFAYIWRSCTCAFHMPGGAYLPSIDICLLISCHVVLRQLREKFGACTCACVIYSLLHDVATTLYSGDKYFPEHMYVTSLHEILSRAFCSLGAQGHSGAQNLGAPFAPLRLQWPAGLVLLANVYAERTPAAISQTKAIPDTQPGCSRSRVPVCLRVLPVPERVLLEA